ncbi:MAG TPA: VTT domain-containing protein [bacterium]|nr:VTT domain-containing protein [bacterium]
MRLFSPIIRILLWVVAAAALAVARAHPAIHHTILVISSGVTVDRLRAYVAAWGPWAPGVSIVIMVLQTFLPFPADPLIMANGVVFGVWEGLLVSVAGALLSGCVAFGLGRRLGRSIALRIVPASVVDWVDQIVHEGTSVSVLLLQFLPAIPFSVLNFLLGLTVLSWATFLWTLGASILPADAVLVLLGRGVAEGHSAVYWTLAALGLLAVASIPARHWFARTWHPSIAQHLSTSRPRVPTLLSPKAHGGGSGNAC